jgi:GT2 family glycosyltransferase
MGAGPTELSPSLDVVIVAYRSRTLIDACLASLFEHPPAHGLSVHVVDNASGDGTVELIRTKYPSVHLTPASRNLGFAAASNLGIRAGAAPYVLLLNPDTRITDGALDALLVLMDERPEVGISGCKLLREDGTPDHAAHRAFPTIAGALGHFTGLRRMRGVPSRFTQYVAPDVAGPVDAVNGAFMLLRRAALREIGLFDEGYWMYMEDLDLCYRFRAAGWVTWYEPSVTVVHVKHGTSGPVRSVRLDRAFHYGMFRFYRKHYAPRRSRVTNLVVYGGIFTRLVASVVRAQLKRVAAP